MSIWCCFPEGVPGPMRVASRIDPSRSPESASSRGCLRDKPMHDRTTALFRASATEHLVAKAQ